MRPSSCAREIFAAFHDTIQQAVLAVLGILFVGGALALDLVLDLHKPMERVMSAFGREVTYFEHKPGILWNSLFIVLIVGMCWLYDRLIAEFARKKGANCRPS